MTIVQAAQFGEVACLAVVVSSVPAPTIVGAATAGRVVEAAAAQVALAGETVRAELLEVLARLSRAEASRATRISTMLREVEGVS